MAFVDVGSNGSMIQKKRTVFLLVFLLFALLCRGKEPDRGDWYRYYSVFKYFKNYPPGTYGASDQNWCILQDRRGILYFANQEGVLEFDGVSWRLIEIPNKTARSMDKDANGTIYVGGVNEIGYLGPDARGQPEYVSLLPHLEEKDRRFSEVYQTGCAANGTWFRTPEKLFRWQGGKFNVWDISGTKNNFKAIFSWKGNCCVQEQGVGIMAVTGDSFQKMPGSDIFGKVKIRMAVPYKDGKLLIGTRPKGFYTYDGITVVPFPTEADGYLKEKRFYYGIGLSGGDFAAATLDGGVVIFDNSGRLKGIFGSDSPGLLDDNVKYVLEDSRGSLWLALNIGISRIDYKSPAYFFDRKFGLKGLVLSVARHRGQLYAGTTSGLYYLETPAAGKPCRFRPVPVITGNCWDLLPVGDSLLAATDRGVITAADTDRARAVIPGIGTFVLAASRAVPGRVWVGADNNVSVLRRKNNRWVEEFQVHCRYSGIRSIAEDSAGNLWLGTLTAGVLKVDFPGGKQTLSPRPRVNHYYEKHGLPEGEVYAARAAGHVVFAASEGIYRFDSAANSFIPDPTPGKIFSDGSRGVFRLVQAKDGHIWLHSELENFHAAPGPGGVFTVNQVVFPMIRRSQVNAIYPEGRMVWFAYSGGLVCYDTEASPGKRRPSSALVRNVTTSDGDLVYDGFRSGRRGETVSPVLEYKNRNLRFAAAAPFFEGSGDVLYRYFLAGFDKDWSAWTDAAFKNYTNLYPGDYTFRVQAKDVFGTAGREETFSFKVLPPWYLTWWAFSLYAASVFFMVYLVVKWRSGKLEKEKQHLERVVEERTREINRANVQLRQKTILLEEQSEQLKEMDKVKSRFFANISHEFRTPLSLIMGPLDQIRSETPDREIKKRIDLAHRNAQRMLGLIDQLLDLAKLDGGKMKLEAEERDLAAFLKALLEPFQLAAQRRRSELVLHTDKAPVPLYFDVEKMEKIMINLLSNALKFTPPGGTITVSVTHTPAPGSQGYVDISVKDTGPGIPPDQLPRIFDRFYQAVTPVEHHHKGSGIGLSLTKELVELHHGEITVRSPAGDGEAGNRGTGFTVRLALGREHLSPAEIKGEGPPSPVQQGAAAAAVEAVEALGTRVEIEASDAGDEFTGEAAESRDQGKEIILLVEDNADLRYYIRTSLGPAYFVEEAKDGREGIEKARAIIPDLIISDIMMPEPDGYELCRIIKNDIITSHIPVVLLTAKTSEASILQGLATGADDYIVKPFNTRVLCARVKNLIELRRQLQLGLNREMKMQPSRINVSKIDREFLNDLQQVFEKNLSEPDFNVEDLSRRLRMSRTTVYRKIQALSGETPTDFIRSYRLKRAAQLLKRNFGSVTEVAFEVGFTSRAYFTKCFKEKFHILPSEFPASAAGTS